MDNILEHALAATTVCKVLVDMYRLSSETPGRFAPTLALIFGIIAAVLLVVADGVDLTLANSARAVLAGIIAAGTAVGVTALQTRVQRPPEHGP